MKEAPEFQWNTNVYKNVKLALTPEEIKAEEDNIDEIAKFLKETAVNKLVQDLKSLDGTP